MRNSCLIRDNSSVKKERFSDICRIYVEPDCQSKKRFLGLLRAEKLSILSEMLSILSFHTKM